MMYRFITALAPAVLALLGCQTHSADTGQQTLTADQSATVKRDVRAFLQTVARDINQEGPIAWEKHFSDRPEFFMAVNGQMVFKNGNDARNDLPKVAAAFRHIDLHWGDTLRVDPLTSELAVVAAPYDEIQVESAGRRVEDTGYFTGTAELHDGGWRFRDAHWSSTSHRVVTGQ